MFLKNLKCLNADNQRSSSDVLCHSSLGSLKYGNGKTYYIFYRQKLESQSRENNLKIDFVIYLFNLLLFLQLYLV